MLYRSARVAGFFLAQLEVQNKDWDRLKKGDLTLQASQIAMTAPEGDFVSVDVVRMHGSVIRTDMTGWLIVGVMTCAALSHVGCAARAARRGCVHGPCAWFSERVCVTPAFTGADPGAHPRLQLR